VVSETFESSSASFKVDLEDPDFVLEVVSSSSETSESSESSLDLALPPLLELVPVVGVSSSSSDPPLALLLLDR